MSATGGVLLVHAHPDDETICTGATMARYAAAGVPVTLVTCTLGEQGEILVAELAGLDAAQADQLGGYRVAELAAAMRALGVTDHRFLGGAGRWRDSGMAGTAANHHPRAFWQAADAPDAFADAVGELVAVIDEVRPRVVITYDPDGDYGHPDHVLAHRVTTAAVAAAQWSVGKVYWVAWPRTELARDLRAAAESSGFDTVPVDEVGFGCADELITTAIDGTAFLDAKRAALAAHRTQILLDGSAFALSNRIGRRIASVEYFRRADADPAVDGPVETDLFAGLTTEEGP